MHKRERKNAESLIDNSWAWYRVGILLAFGFSDSNQEDWKNAYYIWLQYCSNLPAGMNMIGYCLFNGKGVLKNKQEAFKWYLKSAEQGDATAQFIVGHFYYDEFGP